MCGIVGYIGAKEAYPILIKGLKRLEYRGYDSAGAALLTLQGSLSVYKAKGKVASLESVAKGSDTSGCIGIAHTRWATHGEPEERNAHPHLSETKELAMVHNGIIENYQELKGVLIDKGYHFVSDTDTEVLVQLIEDTQKTKQLPLFEAVQLALQEVSGAYAIAILDKKNPQTLVVARKNSPLIVGIGTDASEFFIASDASPIVEYTREVIYVEDGEVVELQRGKAPRVETLQKQPVEPKVNQVSFDVAMIEKGGFPHFMLKEIFEQPDCLQACMRGRVDVQASQITLSSVLLHKDRLTKAHRIVLLGCGTSWHAGLIGKQLLESLVRIPVEVEYASEFRYRNPILSEKDVVIAISQSGETADTLAAIKLAKERGAFVYGICNAVGSSIARFADTGTYIHVGPEIGVASTKAFTGQIMVLIMLALCLGREKGTISTEKYFTLVQELALVPSKIKKILGQQDSVKWISDQLLSATGFIYLGRGFNFPVALEGALKLKELSYIHAEGYPAAEMKHGPIALIDEKMPVVVIAPQDDLYDKIVSNIQEVKARKGRVVSVVDESDVNVAQMSEFIIRIPSIASELTPLLSIIPLQLLSYYIASGRGEDVDQPRNLAKSVTVE